MNPPFKANELKRRINAAIPGISSITVKRQRYTSGGGGNIITITTISKEFVAETPIHKIANDYVVEILVYKPSVHVVTRDENQSAWRYRLKELGKTVEDL